MKRLCWVFAMLAACGGDDSPTGEAELAVTHYEYMFDIETRVAHMKVTGTLLHDGNCTRLPYEATGLRGETVMVNGKPIVEGSAVETGWLVTCGEGRHAGEAWVVEADLVIPLETVGSSQVGYSITEDAQRNPFHYLVSWVQGCDRFGPCDSWPDRFARYTFHVTHPAELAVKCSGTITEHSETATTCDFDHDGGPTYSTFGFAAYPRTAWTPRSKGRWGSVEVTLFDQDTSGIDAAIDPAYHAGFVEWMESTFGPYPYGGELRILTAPTFWSGFEHPGNIVLDQLLAKSQSVYIRPVAHILNHEIAHQWAGNQTTLAGTYDFVWKEAMAEYLPYVYETMADPEAAASTANAWKLFSVGAESYPVPVEPLDVFDFYIDAYGPGPLTLFRQLEVRSSREQVLAGIKSVLGSQRALSIDELLAALEASTGLELDDYARAWIRNTGMPEWPTVALSYMVGGATDFLRVQQVGGVERRCKFHVALRGANPGEELLVPVDTNGGLDQTIPIQPQPVFDVTETVLDPHNECLVLPVQTAKRRTITPWVSPRVVLPHGATTPR